MKNSRDWVRQDHVDEAADKLVAELGCDITEITGYAVAKALGTSANGALYEKLGDWRRRRQSEEIPSVEMAPEAEQQLRRACETQTQDVLRVARKVIADATGEANRRAQQRADDADRRVLRAEAELGDLARICQQTEAALGRVEERCVLLEAQLSDALAREQRLLGRLEQLDAVRGTPLQAALTPPAQSKGEEYAAIMAAALASGSCYGVEDNSTGEPSTPVEPR